MSSFINVGVSAMAVIGSAVFLYAGYSLIDFLALHFILPSRPLSSYKRQGSEPTYALITGASAGIGLGIAKELIAQGFGVILLGHLADELKVAKATLERETPNAAVRLICADARTATPEELQAIVEDVGRLQLSILVNNVGGNAIQLPAFRELRTYSCADVDVVINQNARFMARISALMIPILARKQKNSDGRSLILNLSSGAIVGLAYLVMYGATKAFDLSFSRGLSRELASSPETSHIDCLAILPGEVLSQGNCRGVPSYAPSADEFGRCVVRTVDGAIKRSLKEICPYWLHNLESKVVSLLPDSIMTPELLKVAKLKKDSWDEEHKKSL